jgi:hypothetical protein
VTEPSDESMARSKLSLLEMKLPVDVDSSRISGNLRGYLIETSLK